MKKYLVINGVNLNMLGIREPGIYGNSTLDDLENNIRKKADELGVEVDFFQSNFEGEIVEKIHSAMGNYNGIIINPGAFTHYSYAIRDAFGSVKMDVIEVHISNIHKREEFRHTSVIVPECIGQICGLDLRGMNLHWRHWYAEQNSKLCEKMHDNEAVFYIKLSEYILLQRFHVRGCIFAYFAQRQVYYHRFAIHNTGT